MGQQAQGTNAVTQGEATGSDGLGLYAFRVQRLLSVQSQASGHIRGTAGARSGGLSRDPERLWLLALCPRRLSLSTPAWGSL